MLASLEIVSPDTFAVPISWQNHLHVARQMIVATGGLHHLAQKANGARDKAIFFLSRWFAYLDVLDLAWPPDRPAPITFVVIPEYVARSWWERLLYNQSAKRLRSMLLGRPHTVIVNVPYRREDSEPA